MGNINDAEPPIGAAPAQRKGVPLSARTSSLFTFFLGISIGGGALIVLPTQTGTGSYTNALTASGPGFFPLIAAAITMLAGLTCLITAIRPHTAPVQVIPFRSTLLVGICLAVMGAGLMLIGLLPALAVMTAGLALVFGEKHYWRALLLGPATALLIYGLFESALKILFPRGLLF